MFPDLLWDMAAELLVIAGKAILGNFGKVVGLFIFCDGIIMYFSVYANIFGYSDDLETYVIIHRIFFLAESELCPRTQWGQNRTYHEVSQFPIANPQPPWPTPSGLLTNHPTSSHL